MGNSPTPDNLSVQNDLPQQIRDLESKISQTITKANNIQKSLKKLIENGIANEGDPKIEAILDIIALLPNIQESFFSDTKTYYRLEEKLQSVQEAYDAYSVLIKSFETLANTIKNEDEETLLNVIMENIQNLPNQ
jgi:hypothetical protein